MFRRHRTWITLGVLVLAGLALAAWDASSSDELPMRFWVRVPERHRLGADGKLLAGGSGAVVGIYAHPNSEPLAGWEDLRLAREHNSTTERDGRHLCEHGSDVYYFLIPPGGVERMLDRLGLRAANPEPCLAGEVFGFPDVPEGWALVMRGRTARDSGRWPDPDPRVVGTWQAPGEWFDLRRDGTARDQKGGTLRWTVIDECLVFDSGHPGTDEYLSGALTPDLGSAMRRYFPLALERK